MQGSDGYSAAGPGLNGRTVPVLCRAVTVVVGCAALLFGCGQRDGDRTGGSATLEGRGAEPGGNGGTDGAWFTDVTRDIGLDFLHTTGAAGGMHMAEIMGGGVALFDYDDDGDLDIYLINGNRDVPRAAVVGASSEPTGRRDSAIVGSGPLADGRGTDKRAGGDDGERAGNRLYRQEADGRFSDVTDAAGLGDGGYGMGVAVGDIDNDGHLDLFVSHYGPDSLFRNRGDGTFKDITVKAGAAVDGWSCSAVFFDYNLDGFLDLFVTRYIEFDPLKPCYSPAGVRDYCTPRAGHPMHDVLLRNNGDRTFSDVSKATGIASLPAAGLGVLSEDFNDDGLPDLYVANDGYDNHLWINRGDGTFRNDALILGTAYSLQGVAEAGMGVVAADFENDGDLDLFLTHLRGQTNTLYRNLGGDLGFRDATGGSGLGALSIPYTGFGTAAVDLTLDGDLDVVVVNGRVVLGDPLDGAGPVSPWNRYAEPNLVYVNNGKARFTLLGVGAGSLSGRIEISRGLAVGDLDGDGDQDLVIGNIEGPARVYRNDAPRAGHWLAVRAIDARLRRDAIGARLTVTAGARRFVRTIRSAFSYLSASQPVAHFGLGDVTRVDRIEVRWPGGRREVFDGTPVDRLVRVVRGKGEKPR